MMDEFDLFIIAKDMAMWFFIIVGGTLVLLSLSYPLGWGITNFAKKIESILDGAK